MASVFFAACSDEEVQAPDDFTVSTAVATFKLSDSVQFNLAGNPDNIVFYSGEPGIEYDKRLDFNSDKGTLIYRFASNSRSGETLPRNISVLVSTDFNGQYDKDNLKIEEWTNITDRAIMPANVAPNPDLASGDIDISDLRVEGKPMYFAFRYVSENPTTTAQRYWNMGRMELINKVPGNADYILTSTTAGGMFQIVEFTGANNAWTISTAQSANHRLIHTANLINWEADDDWVISKAFEPFATVPGKPINIKDITKKPITNFLHKYSTPGTYKATFIAMNANKDVQKEIVKEVWVTIEE